MTKLSIPCQWDEESLNDILNTKSEQGVMVGEVYGTISSDNLPHGRIDSAVEKVKREHALKLKSMLDEKQINFAYLLNAPLYTRSLHEIKEDIDWIIYTFNPSSLTITSLELMEFLRKHYRDVNINISTIAGIKEVIDIKRYEHIEPSRIILHHDANRNFIDLEKIIEYGKKKNIIIEIMLNESCLRRCSKRDDHYCSIAKGLDDHDFHVWCNNQKVQKPYQILLANVILPEDISYYENLGLDFFKVTGRSKPVGWLNEVVKAYMNRKYNGNLMRLLAIDPRLAAEKWIYINAASLHGFLDSFPKEGRLEEEVQFCKRKMMELYDTKNFYVENSIAQYNMVNGALEGKIKKDIYRCINHEISEN